MHRKRLPEFEEHPRHLWLESEDHPDRAGGSYVRSLPRHQSIYMVRPQNFHVEVHSEHNTFKNKDQRKTRAKFGFHDQDYALNVTDPIFTARYCSNPPAVGEAPKAVHPPAGDNCLLCVSLTPDFNGYHYKVVATVLELT